MRELVVTRVNDGKACRCAAGSGDAMGWRVEKYESRSKEAHCRGGSRRDDR